ncbi:MAG TPA: phosphonoacetaldehyde reductase [Anaerolineales bacterium]|nr:phosphonoacetaldehyde reductase [Anaerolineales bacterium]HMS00476.1 phosphonoacetaldehyde reductase [Anaerolineales bacterium]HNQ96112.1 phosphonoacetaldehyde reductase [Anaerolineales bacterium]HNS59653.1 phosphonoacetaldehyde reductase [Anaerolineales bacterium]
MNQRIIFEHGGIRLLGRIASELQIKKPLLVTGGASYEACGAKQEIEQVFGDSGNIRFSVSTSLPEIQEVERGIEFLNKHTFDAVIAIGGGCVLDTAKLIRTFAHRDIKTITESSGHTSSESPRIPMIAIPTTAGSGAEATHFAVLYKNNTKYSIAHQNILPTVALIDANLTLSVPPNLAAASGLDALSQGIESYWSANSTEESRGFAKQSIQLAYEALVSAICENNLQAKINLSQAALLAGQAINISKTTAPHAVSYALTVTFGIPHGHAVALTLGEFFALAGAITDKDCNHPTGMGFVSHLLDELCNLLNVADPSAGRAAIKKLVSTLGLATNLSAVGIKESDFAHILKNINVERLENHPQKITAEMIRTILQNIA